MPTTGWSNGDTFRNSIATRMLRPGSPLTGGRLICMGMLFLLMGSLPAWGRPSADQTCLIISKKSGLALQVAEADDGNLANIEAARVNGGAGQCWRLRPERYHDAFAIVSLKSGRVVDVMGYSRKNGANVQQFRDFGSKNQRWHLVAAGEDAFRVVALHSGKCLTVQNRGVEDGANVAQSACGSGDDQLWKIEPYPHSDTAYRIVSRHSGKALDVDAKSKEDGANIQQFHLSGGPNQLWTLYPDGDAGGIPIYSIISYHSGKAVDVQAAETDEGANVQQHAYNGGDNQRWKFVPLGGGEVRIVSVNSGKCLDVKEASADDGANVQQAGCNGGDNQSWRLVPEDIIPANPADNP